MNNALYRGKRIDNGEWVKGSLVLVTGKCAKIMYNVDVWAEIIFHTVDDKGFVTGHRYSVDPSTVGQYTGLTTYWIEDDKELQADVCAGDVLLICYQDKAIKTVVKYEAGMFILCSPEFADSYIPISEEVMFEDETYMQVKIIGNIYDNPELLKEEVSERMEQKKIDPSIAIEKAVKEIINLSPLTAENLERYQSVTNEAVLGLYMPNDEAFELLKKGFQLICKWDYETRSYRKYGVPKDWIIAFRCADMSQHINCAGCGKVLPYGETFTSLELHTTMGIGYGVCNECYEKEWERRRRCENQ